MENPNAKPDLGDDVGDYDDALAAASAADIAIDVFFRESAASTIGLRLHEARNLPKTPPPSLATYEAHYYKATTHGLHAHATPLF
jgi:hypothetical protein